MNSATSRAIARLMYLLPRERLTRAVGVVTGAEVPSAVLQPVLRTYIRAYDVDMSDYRVPEGGFRSFNEFFTRPLKEGRRPVDAGPLEAISPADGRLDDAGEITPERSFLVKGQRYRVEELLDDAREAERYQGGTFAVVYLSPRDYHRVHAPIAGAVRSVKHVPGTLFPVNNFGVKHVPQLFSRNERVVVHLEAAQGVHAAVVLVGAMVVGQIRLAFDAPARPPHGGAPASRVYPSGAVTLERGDEVGAFLLGSTVVLLLAGSTPRAWEVSSQVVGHAVRFGQTIARRSP